MGIDWGKLTAASQKPLPSGRFAPLISDPFGLPPAWCRYEHEPLKIVAFGPKDSTFAAIPSGLGPVVGLWLDSPYIHCPENGC